jgi:hypothetical protein
MRVLLPRERPTKGVSVLCSECCSELLISGSDVYSVDLAYDWRESKQSYEAFCCPVCGTESSLGEALKRQVGAITGRRPNVKVRNERNEKWKKK